MTSANPPEPSAEEIATAREVFKRLSCARDTCSFSPCPCEDIIAQALAATRASGYAAGQQAMRERAASLLESNARVFEQAAPFTDAQRGLEYRRHAQIIRALTPSEEGK